MVYRIFLCLPFLLFYQLQGSHIEGDSAADIGMQSLDFVEKSDSIVRTYACPYGFHKIFCHKKSRVFVFVAMPQTKYVLIRSKKEAGDLKKSFYKKEQEHLAFVEKQEGIKLSMYTEKGLVFGPGTIVLYKNGDWDFKMR